MNETKQAGHDAVAGPVEPTFRSQCARGECKCTFAQYIDPNEEDPRVLWAEIHRLRAAVQGPDGYATWQEAATAERVRRVKAEKDEREACAKVCDEMRSYYLSMEGHRYGYKAAANDCARAIRARSNVKVTCTQQRETNDDK